LESDFLKYRKSLLSKEFLSIASDGAAGIFREYDIYPDIVVSDLDGLTKYKKNLNNWKSLFFIHIHGDNIKLMKTFWSYFNLNKTIFTTQTTEKH
jgi:uncharacterized Rossmann fold enzyme